MVRVMVPSQEIDVARDIRRSAQALSVRYRDHAHHNRKNPLDELLFIMCSVLTQEANYRRTHRALRQAFPTFQSLASASVEEISASIADGGLSARKGAAIHALLERLVDEFGRPTLSPLKGMTDDEAEQFLVSLPLVGKKTARCVMMYSLGRKVFPVDTHCWRVATRRGWVVPSRGDGSCAAVDMDRLQEAIPPELRFSIHVNLLSLGREHCRPTRPNCATCPIGSTCATIGVESDQRVRPCF
jgi:endonuclease III